MKKVLFIVVLVLIAGNSFADNFWASGTDGPWEDTWTWGNADNYPVAGDLAVLNLGSTVKIDGTAQACSELDLASWSGNADLCTLNIVNGGSLDVAGITYIGVANGDVGQLNILGGSSLDVNGYFNVGYNGNGTLVVDGGTVNANGGLFVSNPWTDGTGQGKIDLISGAINVTNLNEAVDFNMSTAGLIDIQAGNISIYGLWWDDLLGTFIGDNRIIGYGGTEDVLISHDGDYTILSAVPEPMSISLLGFGMIAIIRRRK